VKGIVCHRGEAAGSLVLQCFLLFARPRCRPSDNVAAVGIGVPRYVSIEKEFCQKFQI